MNVVLNEVEFPAISAHGGQGSSYSTVPAGQTIAAGPFEVKIWGVAPDESLLGVQPHVSYLQAPGVKDFYIHSIEKVVGTARTFKLWLEDEAPEFAKINSPSNKH